MGSYDEKKFMPFLDYAKTMFNFKIQFIQEVKLIYPIILLGNRTEFTRWYILL